MTVTLNVYMVSDNDFRELGIDYVAWKNGPGAELFATGFDFTDFDSLSKIRDFTSILSEGPLSAATGWGGIMVAPNFDATFLRMLAQKGKAYTAGSAANHGLSMISPLRRRPAGMMRPTGSNSSRSSRTSGRMRNRRRRSKR